MAPLSYGKGIEMFILVEVNRDGCYDGSALVAASEDHNELEKLMQQRVKDAYDGPFNYILPLSEYDKPFNNIDSEYASIGCDGNGEMVEWYIFDTNQTNVTF